MYVCAQPGRIAVCGGEGGGGCLSTLSESRCSSDPVLLQSRLFNLLKKVRRYTQQLLNLLLLILYFITRLCMSGLKIYKSKSPPLRI